MYYQIDRVGLVTDFLIQKKGIITIIIAHTIKYKLVI